MLRGEQALLPGNSKKSSWRKWHFEANIFRKIYRIANILGVEDMLRRHFSHEDFKYRV